MKIFKHVLVLMICLFLVACEHTHEFGDWVVVKEATEEEEGIKLHICYCGEQETDTIEKLAHTHKFGEWVLVKEATIYEEGIIERKCSCGKKETEAIEKIVHTHEFGEWIVVKVATEEEAGLKERTCSCGEKENEVLPKLEHTHKFGDWVVVKEATEEEAGLKERTCSCGEKESEEIAKLEHTHKFGEWVVVKEATEEEEGIKLHICYCGVLETDTIEKLAHTHKFGGWVLVKEATIYEEGIIERECSCGEKETEVLPKLEHTHKFGEWVVVKEATLEEAGLKERECACGEKESEEIAKLVMAYDKILFGAAFEGEEVEVDGVKYFVGETAFTNMNEALAKAAEGATIYVLAGTYEITEMINVEKPVTFVGPNADKGVNEEREEEAMFTSDNYNTGSFMVTGADITFNGIGFKGVGEQGYPIQSGAVLENFTIKSCYAENVNTVFCPYDSTEFKGTFVITETVNYNNLQFLAWIAGDASALTKFEFTNNKVYGEVAGHFAGKGMISFRATDSNAEVVIEGNEFDLEDYVLASNPIYVASGNLVVKNNKFTGVAEDALFFEGTVEATLENNEFAPLPEKPIT